MKGELISFKTKDHIMLDGFISELTEKNTKTRNKQPKTCIVYVHGLCGMMGRGELKDSVYNLTKKLNYSFLMFNNRGFGMINAKSHEKTGRYITMGGSVENFEDCLIDIKAVVTFLKSKNYKNIVLLGHSTGCQKVTYYMNNKPDKSIKAVILLAPANDREGWEISTGAAKLNRMINKAKFISKNRPNELVCHLSAKRFYDLLKPTSIEGNIFNYNEKSLPYLEKIKVPVFAAFGSREQYNKPKTHKKKLNLIKKSCKNPLSDTLLVKYGNHGFSRHTKELCDEIVKWLKKVT